MHQLPQSPSLPTTGMVQPSLPALRCEDDPAYWLFTYPSHRDCPAQAPGADRLDGTRPQRAGLESAGQRAAGHCAKPTMTRTYAAKRLFEHGPLTFREFVVVTGWPMKQAAATLEALKEQGIVKAFHAAGCTRRLFALDQ